MSPMPSLARMPKIDLHRHLEGSLRLHTILETAEQFDLDLPREEKLLAKLVQVSPSGPRDHDHFLKRFGHIRKIFQSPDVITRVVKETIEDAAIDNVKYLELRFTPAALSQARQFAISDVIDWVIEATQYAQEAYSIAVGLIASVNRQEDPGIASEVLKSIDGGEIIGIDLAGDEVNASSSPFEATFRDAKVMGLGIVVHAGEWAGGKNVRDAILNLGATRIGHGVRVMDEMSIVELARDHGVYFEVSLSSNYLTGVVENYEDHPLVPMIQSGLQTVLTTDDPGIFHTSLTKEFELAVNKLQLSESTLKALTMTAAQACFLPRRKKRTLEDQMIGYLWGRTTP